MILLDYVSWQFWLAPAWLARLAWNTHRSLLRSFSVPLLARTFIAPWRRDQLSYHGLPLEAVIKNFFLNCISRVIGALIRSVALLAWLIGECALLAGTVIVLTVIVLAPALSVALVVAGLMYLAS